MDYLIENIDLLKEDILFEMANIQKSDTGLPYDIWIDSAGRKRGNEHSGHPRLKIQVDNELIPVDITDDPKIPDSVMAVLGDEFIAKFAKIKKYMIVYKEVLLAHYNGQISDDLATSMLKTLGKASEALEKLHKLLDKQNISYITYSWDNDECLFVINYCNSSNECLITKYAADKSDLSDLLNTAKLTFGSKIKITEI